MKTYSSGMVVRLAFAVAINVDPEILLVDEALAVGDIYFRQRCMRKVHELRARGITILFVSHAVERREGHRRPRAVAGPRPHGRARRTRPGGRQIPGRHGREGLHVPAAAKRPPEPQRAAARPMQAPEIVETIPNIDHRYGDGRARDHRHRRARRAGPAGCTCWSRSSRIVVRISVRAKEDVPLPIVGFMLRNHLGMDFSGTNTAREGYELAPMQAGRHRHGGFPSRPAGALSGVVFFFAGDCRRHAGGLPDVRLDR